MPAACNTAANFGPIPSIRSRSSGILRLEGFAGLVAVFFGLLEGTTSATTSFFDLVLLEVFVAVVFGLGLVSGEGAASSAPTDVVVFKGRQP